MSSLAEFSTKVIRVVAFGAGAVAIGWLGWKAYEAEAEIVPAEDAAAGGEIVEEVPADEDVIKVCETADGEADEPVCAPPLMAAQESCAVDSIFAPVEPVHDEDATIQSDVVCVSNEEAELPSPADVPACEEHTPVAAVEAVPVPAVRKKKKPNKALEAMEQQVPDNVASISEPVIPAPVEDAPADPESVPVESAEVPASEEPTPVSSREELPAAPNQDRSADLANMSLEELSAVPAGDVSYWPNKTSWNASFQRRYLARLKLGRV
ncbi:hypothetical protein GHT06_007729 [Daphnia sinensis]|uniref:Uncharacterized protein n=1 Tax=Daphnia sinensis TaxID=1820382 RepID=A0AAD5L063_9CRUS|nr:hypothetical protein GHT06_007729 [Daphnia sinensis]